MNPEQNHTISQVGGNTTPEPVSKATSQASSVPITGYNMRCPAVKRLMREAAELATPEEDFAAHPTESNLFEWHFTIRGPEASEYENGVYHGRIIFPSEYPMKPPSFILLTPNGRFQTEEKICLSISNYHPETWLPSWSIRTALVALRSFMNTPGNEGAIGSLNFDPKEKKKLAIKSRTWECRDCGPIIKLLPAQKENVDVAKSNANLGQGDSAQSQLAEPTNSAVQPEIPNDEAKAITENVAGNEKKENNSEGASASATIGNDNHAPVLSAIAAEEHISQLQQRQQQNEPIKTFIYDFGIGCFVVLILALCLRRLFTLLLQF